MASPAAAIVSLQGFGMPNPYGTMGVGAQRAAPAAHENMIVG